MTPPPDWEINQRRTLVKGMAEELRKEARSLHPDNEAIPAAIDALTETPTFDPKSVRRKLELFSERLHAGLPVDAENALKPEVVRFDGTEHAREIETQKAELLTLSDRVENLSRDVQALGEEKTANDLSKAYSARATRDRHSWWIAAALLVALSMGFVVTALLLHQQFPLDGDKPTTDERVTALAVTVGVLGAIVYLIRIVSLSYRVHRGLEVVNSQKADVLETFPLLLQTQRDEEVRVALASPLAAYLFARERNGYEADAPPVTGLEQLARAAIAKIPTK